MQSLRREVLKKKKAYVKKQSKLFIKQHVAEIILEDYLILHLGVSHYQTL